MIKKKILVYLMLFGMNMSVFIKADYYWDNFELHCHAIETIQKEYMLPKVQETPLRNWQDALWNTGQEFFEGFKFLGTKEGAKFTIDSTIGLAISGLSLAAYIYLLVKLQMYMIQSQMQQEGLQVYYPGQITCKLCDVAGLAGAKADVQDIITYLQNPYRYKNIGACVPKGVLLNGSPGNGKTILARAVAGEVNCPFISVNGSAFVQLYVGVGAQRVRGLFSLARKLAVKYGACIIFIDEIDAVALQRASVGGGHHEHDQTLNALLAEMDGLEQSGNPVIVLGATNRAHLLDEAVVRAGRFDRKVEVAKLNIKDRVELLELAVKKVKVDSSVNIHRIARFTRGFSGAELANLVNEAAILAANAGKKSVLMEDIELAFDNITLGPEIKGMEQSADKLWKTAIHEAGHTMATILCDNCHIIHKVSIAPRSHTLGSMRKLPLYESYDFTQQDLENSIVIALCGRLAEQEFGMDLSTGASDDLQKAHTLAYEMVALYGMSDSLQNIAYNQRYQLPNDIATQVEREVEKIIARCTQVGKKLLTDHRQDIEKIAQLLAEKQTIVGDEVYQALGRIIPCTTEVL